MLDRRTLLAGLAGAASIAVVGGVAVAAPPPGKGPKPKPTPTPTPSPTPTATECVETPATVTRCHTATPSGFTPPLAAGARASSTTVGYFPEYGALTTYNPGGTPPTGWAWDGDALISTTSNAVLNLALVNGAVVDNDGGATITKCRILCPVGQIYGVTAAGTGIGFTTVEDTTVVGAASGAFQVNGISSDDGLIARRCHVTQTGDGIHLTTKTGTLVSQCYVGNLRFIDEEQHLDGMQIFQDDTTGSVTVEHCYIARTVSTIGTPINAALTMGPPTESGPTFTPTINNNFFESGLYHLRFNHMARNAVVTNNDFGPIHASEFGYHEFDTGNGSTYATWSNNRDENGSLLAAP